MVLSVQSSPRDPGAGSGRARTPRTARSARRATRGGPPVLLQLHQHVVVLHEKHHARRDRVCIAPSLHVRTHNLLGVTPRAQAPCCNHLIPIRKGRLGYFRQRQPGALQRKRRHTPRARPGSCHKSVQDTLDSAVLPRHPEVMWAQGVGILRDRSRSQLWGGGGRGHGWRGVSRSFFLAPW